MRRDQSAIGCVSSAVEGLHVAAGRGANLGWPGLLRQQATAGMLSSGNFEVSVEGGANLFNVSVHLCSGLVRCSLSAIKVPDH